MNDNNIVHPSDDLADDLYSNIDYRNVQQEQTSHNGLYALADTELQLSSDLEDPNQADGWKSTNSEKGELVIAYDTNTGNNTLRPRIFYELYIGPNNEGNGHLIYKLSIDQILVTMKYQSVPIPEDLINTMNKIDSSDNKIQIDHFDSDQSIVWDNHSNNNDNDSQTPNNDVDNSEGGSHGKSDSSQQLNDLK